MASCCCWLLYRVAGSTTGVPMSPGYGGCQTATPPPYYATTTYATTIYYTKAPEYFTTWYAAHLSSEVLFCP